VGTYSIIDKDVLLSARIMDNKTGKIVAAASTYYHTNDCSLLENCKKPRRIKIIKHQVASL